MPKKNKKSFEEKIQKKLEKLKVKILSQLVEKLEVLPAAHPTNFQAVDLLENGHGAVACGHLLIKVVGLNNEGKLFFQGENEELAEDFEFNTEAELLTEFPVETLLLVLKNASE